MSDTEEMTSTNTSTCSHAMAHSPIQEIHPPGPLNVKGNVAVNQLENLKKKALDKGSAVCIFFPLS